MVPLLVIIPMIASGLGGLGCGGHGATRLFGARSRYAQRRRAYEGAVSDYAAHRQRTQDRLLALRAFREECRVTLEEGVAFLKASPKARSEFATRLGLDATALPDLKIDLVHPLGLLGVGLTATTAAAGTAATVTSAVGAFGSTAGGTAISGLSGAAANNATLAWLGGGSLASGGGGMSVGAVVLGGAAAAAVVLVVGLAIYAKSSSVETDVAAALAQLDVGEAKLRSAEVLLEGIERRAQEIETGLRALRDCLRRLLDGADPNDAGRGDLIFFATRSLARAFEAQILDPEGRPATAPVG